MITLVLRTELGKLSVNPGDSMILVRMGAPQFMKMYHTRMLREYLIARRSLPSWGDLDYFRFGLFPFAYPQFSEKLFFYSTRDGK